MLARLLEPATANGGLARKLSPSHTTLGRHFRLRRKRRNAHFFDPPPISGICVEACATGDETRGERSSLG